MMSAIFGLVGVLIGSLLSLAKDLLADKRSLDRSARYLAIRVVCILDRYLEDCVAVVEDDGLFQGERSVDGYLQPQIPSPGPPIFPDDGKWESLPHDLMYRILALPAEVQSADQSIQFISSNVASAPDFEDFFEARACQYAGFGLAADDLAQDLRNKYDISARKWSDWDPVSRLNEKKVEIEQTWAKRAFRVLQATEIDPGLVGNEI